MITTAFLVMQFIISAKAGLVNSIEGTANVHVQEMVPAGAPIQTGPNGRVEILLNPGTFLRLGEDSQAVLDSVDLADVQVHILSGSAVIECGSVEKDSPIRVTDGTETVTISKPGTYRFPEDAVSASLDDWNQQRSELIAAANARSAATDAASNNPAFPSQGWPLYPGSVGASIYPGSAWPNGLYPGVASPFSYYPSYLGGYGYGFYQPLGAMPPLVLLYPRPVITRPLPRPVAIAPRPGTATPVTSRPPVPVTRPPSTSRPVSASSHVGARAVGAGGRR
jgi:hypothetical protein